MSRRLCREIECADSGTGEPDASGARECDSVRRFGGRSNLHGGIFQQAVRSYQAASLLNPEEPRIWNELGYAMAWTRNLNGARQALQEYERLAPDDANALDSLGEVSFFLGDFESAAKYFEQAAQRSRRSS